MTAHHVDRLGNPLDRSMRAARRQGKAGAITAEAKSSPGGVDWHIIRVMRGRFYVPDREKILADKRS